MQSIADSLYTPAQKRAWVPLPPDFDRGEPGGPKSARFLPSLQANWLVLSSSATTLSK
ncbi:MAG: hypothetical protein KF713_00655 [Turneriella sp.]|nr:hypothetical protein [Turneriella sp.]